MQMSKIYIRAEKSRECQILTVIPEKYIFHDRPVEKSNSALCHS